MSQLIDHWFCDPPRESRSGTVNFSGTVVTTTAGTLGTGAANVDTPFFTLTKTAAKAGRYKVQLIDSRGNPVVAPKLTKVMAWLIGDTDAAIATAKGVWMGTVRNNLLSTLGTFEIQFQRTDTGVDAEVSDAAVIGIAFSVKKSSATP